MTGYGLAQIARNNIASINKQIGKFAEALAVYNQLVNEANTQQNVARQILSLNHIGDIYRAQGRLLESKKHHMQALNLCDQISKLASKLTTLRYLMRTHLADLDYSSAQSLLHEVYELRSREGEHGPRFISFPRT
jgi:tetratricopeptide (TPR) repeat protein